MSKVITVCGEENIGKTTTALFLAKTICELSPKSKVLVVDLDIKKPSIYNILSKESSIAPRFNIDTIMNYAISTKDLTSVIKANAEKMNNSTLEIIMGTNNKNDFEENQYVNFLNEVEKLYDFIIIDTCSKPHNILLEYSNTILFVINQSYYNISRISNCYWKIINNEKTEILINKYEAGISDTKFIETTLAKTINHKILYDKNVIRSINKGTLSLDECDYSKSIIKVTKTILKDYGIVIKTSILDSITDKFLKRGGKRC